MQIPLPKWWGKPGPSLESKDFWLEQPFVKSSSFLGATYSKETSWVKNTQVKQFKC